MLSPLDVTPQQGQPLRVLHSFPHRLGMSRICTTAWYEIDSCAAVGGELTVLSGDSIRPFDRAVKVRTTLSRGRLRLPYKLVGTRRICAIHDWIVARQLPSLRDKIDIIHAWPLAGLQTIRVAKTLGIPVAMERCNAHTRYAYESVRIESERIGVKLPKDFEHVYNARMLETEEHEYQQSSALLCPSDFVVKTFQDQGIERAKLERFIYGVDIGIFTPEITNRPPERPFTMIFAGLCAVRKGLHFALEAWLGSEASNNGRFLIAGDFLPAYRDKLRDLLDHPSIKILGNRKDLPDLMRTSDLFILPSIEEGFGLVCTEAMASGCVPLVSEACTEVCRHLDNSMVHSIGDTHSLSNQISLLYRDSALRNQLRESGIANREAMSWDAAGRSLMTAYRNILDRTS